jgi:type I restriction enzyme M protein
LEGTNEKVVQSYEKFKDMGTPDVLDRLLKQASGQNFYNKSDYTLVGLTKDINNIGVIFDAYLNGFSENIKDILLNFNGGPEKGISPIYETVLRKDLLLIVTKKFVSSKIDLHPDKVCNHYMGTIFEILIRKLKETSNEKAGWYFTPRDIVSLMVNLVFDNETDKLQKEVAGINIYDPCCGTGGMLTTAKIICKKPIIKTLMFGFMDRK